MISKISLRNGNHALDFARMATMYGFRRDWAPHPQTVAWTYDMQRELLSIAQELEAEALALQHDCKGAA
jgi:hypothetical protein